MKLIDADKLLENYKKWIPQLSSKEDEGDRRGVETCIAVLEDTPAVDAVPVVRCDVCVLEGNCFAESHFRFAGMKNPFCCAGQQKAGDKKWLTR